MRIIKSEQTSFWDVDGTLILPYNEINKKLGRIADVYDSITKNYIKMVVHEPMVRLLKEEKHRGAHVIVWSRGGYEWAANVVRALDLVSYVNDVMSKPMAYFDDVEIKDWLPYRVYLEPTMQYKTNN